jgi:transposase InsO family protein
MNFSSKEELRIDVISRFLNGDIHAEHAWTVLEIGERQFRRYIKSFLEQGVFSVKHGNFGRVPKNKTGQPLANQIVSLYKNKYWGFNTQHFREKLREEDLTYIPSYSVLRLILIENGINIPKIRSRPSKSHKSRNRCAKEGIMAQIDGSHHDWFGMKKSCLNAILDDANGKILAAKFTPTETTFAAMDIIEEAFKKYGIFQMLYSDGAGVYHGHKRDGFSSVQKAIKPLGVLSLVAPTAEAKGKIERLFRTLQDRLVNEMRLRKICSIEEANSYLPSFIEYFNATFSVLPENSESAFRPLPVGIDLNQIMCIREERVVHRGYAFSYKNKKYVIKGKINFPMIGKIIEIRIYRDDSIQFYFNDQLIEVEELKVYQRPAA